MEHYSEKASEYMQFLCGVKPSRRTGSLGNKEATDFFEKTIRAFGYGIDATPFESMDYICNKVELTVEDKAYEVYGSPYSMGCDITSEIVTVSTIEELENINFEGKLLLLKGEICEEQLMPKNFVFYNPEQHQKIILLLESRKPGGIITGTKKNPDLVGALDPFPLFADGDFNIPSIYCKDSVAERIAELTGVSARLQIDARRIPSASSNVIASINKGKAHKIVITAHIDAYESTPGASDNASGTAVLLLAAEMLKDYKGKYSLEFDAFNGEDHYSAGGQMDYLKRYGDELSTVLVAINIDDVGYKQGKSSYSFYECQTELEEKAEEVFGKLEGLSRGEQWFNGDHMVFIQNQVPAIAFTSELMVELLRTVTHTSADTPDLID